MLGHLVSNAGSVGVARAPKPTPKLLLSLWALLFGKRG
jgi:hypothetical protein